MEKASDFIKFFKERTLMKELVSLITGIFFLLILNIIFHPNLSTIPNSENLGAVFKILFILTVSYFIYQISYEIGRFFVVLIIYLFCKKDKISRLQKNFKSFIELINSEAYKPSDEERRRISMMRAADHFKESPYTISVFDEAYTRARTNYSFLGFSLLIISISFFVPHSFNLIYFFILISVLTFNSLHSYYNLGKSARKLASMYEMETQNRRTQQIN